MGPSEALKTAVRAMLLADTLLASRVIGAGEILPKDPLPAGKITIHSNLPEYTFGPTEVFRDVRFSVEWLGKDANGKSALGNCDPLNERTRELLFNTIETNGVKVAAHQRLNVQLEPLGYSSDIIMEDGEITAHLKRIGRDADDVRWTLGYFYKLNLSRN